jgi:nucleotide-binding universal stress UspA family protein
MPLVLVAVDFSPCSLSLVDEAARFARAFGSRLLMLHAADAPPGLPLEAKVHPAGAEHDSSVAEALTADAETHLASLAERVRASGLEVQTRVAFGRIPEVILQQAQGSGAGLIVLGTHGRTGFRRAVLGSVAEEVIRRADVPVVTIRTHWQSTCAAAGCALCSAGRTEVEHALAAEVDG